MSESKPFGTSNDPWIEAFRGDQTARDENREGPMRDSQSSNQTHSTTVLYVPIKSSKIEGAYSSLLVQQERGYRSLDTEFDQKRISTTTTL